MRRTGAGLIAGALALALLAVAAPAGATGSVVGTDNQTNEVGSALASCIAAAGTPASLQRDMYRPVAGRGVILAQAWYFGNSKEAMATKLASGQSPASIVGAITGAAENDRQYLVASLTQPGAGFTGTSGLVPLPAGHLATSSPDGRFKGVAAGNTLSRDTIVPDMASALSTPPDVVAELEKLMGRDIPESEEAELRKGDLAERLFLGLASGFDDPANAEQLAEGDVRCVNGATFGNTSSGVAWVRVDGGDGTAFNLGFASVDKHDAVKELAEMYYDCRLGRELCKREEIAIAVGIAGDNLALRSGLNSTLDLEAHDAWLKSFDSEVHVDGAFVDVHVGGEVQTIALPAEGWRKKMNGGKAIWIYADPRGELGPIREVKVDTRKGKLTLQGARGGFDFTLDERPAAVDIVLRADKYTRYCAHFEDETRFLPGSYLRYRDAGPEACIPR